VAQIDAKVFFRGLCQGELIIREKAFANQIFGKLFYGFPSQRDNGLFFKCGANKNSFCVLFSGTTFYKYGLCVTSWKNEIPF
jgi:hypothetical protein